MYWRSGKISRKCRSLPAAEVRAGSDCEDELYAVRYQWAELNGWIPNIWEPDLQVNKVTAVLVTDSKGLYDKMKQTVTSLKGLEKRVDIEAFGIKDSMNDTGLTVWWVHGDAQIGNSLTKPNEPHQLNLSFP